MFATHNYFKIKQLNWKKDKLRVLIILIVVCTSVNPTHGKTVVLYLGWLFLALPLIFKNPYVTVYANISANKNCREIPELISALIFSSMFDLNLILLHTGLYSLIWIVQWSRVVLFGNCCFQVILTACSLHPYRHTTRVMLHVCV
jgi:hypothetical protein